MLFRFNRLAATTLGLLMLVTSMACGSSSSATDYGSYPSHRVDGDYDSRPSRARGILVESLRLGEQIVLASDIDPDLTVGRGGGVFVDHHGPVLGSVLSGPQTTALEKYDVLAGTGALAANKPYDAENQAEKFLAVSLVAFPDEQTAAAAARDMESLDFQAAKANSPVTLDAYPQAMSHWQPGVPTLGSWMVWKTLVIRVLARLTLPDLGRLMDMVTRTYQRQLAALESFTATPAKDVPNLVLDPDKLLPRLVKTGDYTPDEMAFALYSPRAFALRAGENPAADLSAFTAQGVTAVGISHNKFLYRTRDSAAATDLAAYLAGKRGETEQVPMRGIRDLPSVTCSQATRPSTLPWPRRFRCIVVRDDLVALLYSDEETDIRRIAAAQYAVMVDV